MTWKKQLPPKAEDNFASLPLWRQFHFPDLETVLNIVKPMILAFLVGWIFDRLQVPVGWLLGPMLCGIVYAVAVGNPQPLPPVFITVGKSLIGITTAFRFSPDTLVLAETYAVPVLICILITGGLSMVNGYLLCRWAGIDLATGFLGSIPGAAAGIVAMSEEMGADAIAVAVLQYLRVMMVVLIVPLAVSYLFPVSPLMSGTAPLPLISPSSMTFSSLSASVMSPNLLVLVGCCALGIGGGKLLRLPSAGFLGTFLVGLLVFWGWPHQFQVPQSLFTSGLLLVGLAIGLQFDWTTAIKLLKALVIEVGLVLVLIACCFGVGYEFHLLTHVDTMTAILGSTPGGIEAMIATVMEMGGDTGMVLAMQLTRMLLILLIGPGLIAIVLKRDQNSQ